MKNNLDIQAIIADYNNGMGVEKLTFKYHVGKIKIKNILIENGVTLKKRGGQSQNKIYVVSDWKIEKYPAVKGYHYVAIFKEDGKEFCDHMNQGGFLTSYIKKKVNIEIPTLYDRRKYYMETGNYWWEQWFAIEKRENKPTKKCPYCKWETEDVNNRAGVFEQHLKERHNITKEDYLLQYPDDKSFFTLVNKTLNRQMSNNKDEFVTCAICGKKLARIDWRHLKEHGITKDKYIQKYGFNTVSKQLHDTLSTIAVLSNMEMEPTVHSKPELEIMDFIKSHGLDCRSNRKILHGKEIDIFVAEKNIGIEFNGNKFHTEWGGGKSRQYHLNKTKLCKQKGVKLIHIFEDEFHNSKEIVLNKIGHILGIQQNLRNSFQESPCTLVVG